MWDCVQCTYRNHRPAGRGAATPSKCQVCSGAKPPALPPPTTTASPISLLDDDDEQEEQQQAQQQGEKQGNGDDDAAARPAPSAPRRVSNPFAAFAFDDGAPGSSNSDNNSDRNGGSSSLSLPPDAPLAPAAAPAAVLKRPATTTVAAAGTKRARAGAAATGKRHECGPPEDFDAMKPYERQLVYRKWQSILAPALKGLPSPPTTPQDINRFRFIVLCAVILSSRTQEAMVRQAMQRMAALPNGGFTVETLAAIDPAVTSPLHERISFVHINKVKSRYIVLSARRIRDELGGQVPTDMKGLLSMHGIGPTLAPLLLFLYKYQEERSNEKAQGEMEGGSEQQEERSNEKAQQQQQQEAAQEEKENGASGDVVVLIDDDEDEGEDGGGSGGN